MAAITEFDMLELDMNQNRWQRITRSDFFTTRCTLLWVFQNGSKSFESFIIWYAFGITGEFEQHCTDVKVLYLWFWRWFFIIAKHSNSIQFQFKLLQIACLGGKIESISWSFHRNNWNNWAWQSPMRNKFFERISLAMIYFNAIWLAVDIEFNDSDLVSWQEWDMVRTKTVVSKADYNGGIWRLVCHSLSQSCHVKCGC